MQRFMSWYDLSGQDNRFIYDYKKEIFIEVYEDAYDNPMNNFTIYNMFDNLIMLYDNRENDNGSKSLCIVLGE